MKRNIWVFGLLSGAIVAAFMAVSTFICYRSGSFNVSMLLGYTGMLIAFSFVFVGIKNYRDQYSNGIISFGRALKVGGLIAFIGCTMYVLAWLLEYYFIFPDFMDKYAEHTLQQAQANHASLAEIQQQMREMKQYKEAYESPLGVIAFTYIEILPVALVVTLISAFILKRRSKMEAPVAV